MCADISEVSISFQVDGESAPYNLNSNVHDYAWYSVGKIAN